jgi:microcystin-dependent protein
MKKTMTLLLVIATLSFSNNLSAQDFYLGEIRMFAGNFAPQGWMKCEGQILSIAQNSALFSLLGTTYGGNGTTTFALPDLRGRAPIHSGQGPGLSVYSLGQQGGTESTTLTVNNLPAHNHAINGIVEDGNSPSPTGNFPAGTKLLDPEYANTGTVTQMNANMVGNTGNSNPINNMQPYPTVTYIIALQGIYPSQN